MIPFLRWPDDLRITPSGCFKVLTIPSILLLVVFRFLVCDGGHGDISTCAARSDAYSIAGWGGVLFVAMLFVCVWWFAIGVLSLVDRNRRNQESGGSLHGSDAGNTGVRAPGFLATLRFVGRITLADLFALGIALAFFGLMGVLVLGLPNVALVFLMSFLGADRALLVALVTGEAWFLSIYLFLVAYAAHSGVEFRQTSVSATRVS